MRRFVMLLGVGVLIAIPVAIFVISQRQKLVNQAPAWPLIQTTPVPERYSVESDVPGYTMKLTDTKFLDYVSENIGIFKPDAVVDPESYQGGGLWFFQVSHGCCIITTWQFPFSIYRRKTYSNIAALL